MFCVGNAFALDPTRIGRSVVLVVVERREEQGCWVELFTASDRVDPGDSSGGFLGVWSASQTSQCRN